MRFFLSFLLFTNLLAALAEAAPSALAECEEWLKAAPPVKGVVVVAHGLNLRPAKMVEMGLRFRDAGYDVLVGAFTGHCRFVNELNMVQPLHWEEDVRRMHGIASARAKELGVPLSLVAYSFSALVFQVLAAEFPFGKRILFAPAFETYFWYPIVVWISGLIPNYAFHTLIPEGYYANQRGGLRSMLALNHFLKRWRAGEGRQDKAPTLVWADFEDELVNAKKLSDFASTKSTWTFESTNVKGSQLKRSYHHLIIDQAAVGPQEWSRMMDGSIKFLESGSKPQSSSL